MVVSHQIRFFALNLYSYFELGLLHLTVKSFQIESSSGMVFVEAMRV